MKPQRSDRPICFAAATAAAVALSVGCATAQTQVFVPAPAAAQAKAAYRCQVTQAVDGGVYHAGRDLDADGRFVSQSMQWEDGHLGQGRPLTVTVDWRGPGQAFRDGRMALWFEGATPMDNPLQFTLVSAEARAVAFNAGRGYSSDKTAETSLTLGDLMAVTSDAKTVDWRIDGLDGYGGKVDRTYMNGTLDLAFLAAAEAGFTVVTQALDTAAADPKANCRTL